MCKKLKQFPMQNNNKSANHVFSGKINKKITTVGTIIKSRHFAKKKLQNCH
jgi:hypothetical protein